MPTVLVSIVLHITIVTNYFYSSINAYFKCKFQEYVIQNVLLEPISYQRMGILNVSYMYYLSQNHNIFIFCAPYCLLVNLTFSRDLIVTTLSSLSSFQNSYTKRILVAVAFVCFYYPKWHNFFQKGTLEALPNVHFFFNTTSDTFSQSSLCNY